MNGTTRVCQGVIFDSVEMVKGILQYYFLVFAEVFYLLNCNLSHSPLPLNEKSRVPTILQGGGVNNYTELTTGVNKFLQ